nr:MAG TPA: Regulatory protein [Inoviridae sp.]
MTVMTKADFAREIKRTRQYVDKLAKQGKLVMVKKKRKNAD